MMGWWHLGSHHLDLLGHCLSLSECHPEDIKRGRHGRLDTGKLGAPFHLTTLGNQLAAESAG
jgi:hypothetical protein